MGVFQELEKVTYSSAGVTSVRANRAVFIFSVKKKEACLLNPWKKSLPMLLLFDGKIQQFSESRE